MTRHIATLCINLAATAVLLAAVPAHAGKPGGPPGPSNPAITFILNGQVNVMNANGSGIKRLTNSKGSKNFPTWFPSGNRIAFRNMIPIPGPGMSATFELRSINVDGSNEKTLCPGIFVDYGRQPNRMDISPDGNWVVVPAEWNNARDLWAVNVNTCEKVQLTFNSLYFYSWPFGDTGLTAYGHGGGWNLDGAQKPAWSGDLDLATPGYQTVIAFTEFSCLTLRPDGTCTWNVEGTYERDGNSDVMYIFVDIVDGQLVVDANQIPVPLGPIDDGAPGIEDDLDEYSGDWDAAGTELIFTKDDCSKCPPIPPSQLVKGVFKVSRTTDEEVFLWSQPNNQPRWSPDSAWFCAEGIYRVRANPANPAPTLLTTGANPDWNPKWVNDIGY